MPKTRSSSGSGEKLLRDPEKFKALKELNGKIVKLLKWEGAGVSAACALHKKPVLMIRGISDFCGNSTKDRSLS